MHCGLEVTESSANKQHHLSCSWPGAASCASGRSSTMKHLDDENIYNEAMEDMASFDSQPDVAHGEHSKLTYHFQESLVLLT